MLIIKKHLQTVAIFLFFLVTGNAYSQLRLPNVIGNNMVIQCNQVVPIWGWAKKNDIVTVTFDKQRKAVTADVNGYWKVSLSPSSPSAKPQKMLIRCGADTIQLENILIGEVWLCSGQSNMRYPMKNTYQKAVNSADSLEIELKVNESEIRLFLVQNKFNVADVVTMGWQTCSGEAVANFSAIGYFFAKTLHQRLNVPVGMICSAVNGTQIEPWIPASEFYDNENFKREIENGTDTINGVKAGKIFDSMIKPLAPFKIKGVIWYQGESNVMTNDGMLYATKMRLLISSWRKTWANDSLPFNYVQLAPFTYTHRRQDKAVHTTETLPEIWEAQGSVLSTPFTEIVTISDLVDKPNNLHPPYKWVVGRRLAALAMNRQYGFKNIEFTGPRFNDLQVNGTQIVVNFTHAKGLRTKDGKDVDWITVAGRDGVYRPAVAKIKNSTLVVSSVEVPEPKFIRFGWDETAQPNLINDSGLPVMPFRSGLNNQRK